MDIKIQNSYCGIAGDVHPDVDQLLTHMLTYRNDIDGEVGMLFHRMKWYKSQGEMQKFHAAKATIAKLQANEFVCLYKNRQFPTGLLNMVVEALKALGTTVDFHDLRTIPQKDVLLRWNNKPWDPRYYQNEMIRLGLENGRGVFQAAVGSGKSLVMAYLVKELSVTTLIVVPSRGLCDQLYNDFSNWFGHKSVDILDAQKIRKLKQIKPISIITIQSCASLKKSGEFQEFAKNFEAIHYDEIHHAGSSSYVNLLLDLEHIYYRFGYSGTFIRNDNKTLDMWSCISNVLYNYPAHQATSEGYLTPMEVFVHTMQGKSSKKYDKEYTSCYCGNPAVLKRVYEVCNSIGPENQVLILVNRKDTSGKLVHEYLKTLGIENSYISGDDKSSVITKTIEDFNSKKINRLIGSSVISEGIDIRSTDHLVNLKGGRSEIALVQAMGRAIRIFPGKSVAYVHDFKFTNTNYMEKHFDSRMESIEDNFKPNKIYYV